MSKDKKANENEEVTLNVTVGKKLAQAPLQANIIEPDYFEDVIPLVGDIPPNTDEKTKSLIQIAQHISLYDVVSYLLKIAVKESEDYDAEDCGGGMPDVEFSIGTNGRITIYSECGDVFELEDIRDLADDMTKAGIFAY